jgi:uncharacterized metal-binding protein YceD (DUF177 family)
LKNYENDPQYLNIFEITKRNNEQKAYSCKLQMTDFLGTEMEGIQKGKVAEFNLVLASVSDGVYLSGKILVDLTSTCSRCLKTRNHPIELQPQAFYLYETVPEDEDLDENLYSLNGGHYIDLLQILRDSLFEILEFNPICDINCQNEFANPPENDPQEDSPFAELLALKEKL